MSRFQLAKNYQPVPNRSGFFVGAATFGFRKLLIVAQGRANAYNPNEPEPIG